MQRIFIVFLAVFFISPGLHSQQDTVYWEQYDARIFEEAGNNANSEEEYYALVRSELAKRRTNGPLTASLAYNYHTFARQLRIPQPDLALTYIDTALAMKTEIRDVKRDIAQSYYAKGRILTRLGDNQSALRTYDLALELMNETFIEQDSLPDIARRLAYFYVEGARSARENGNYALAELRLAQIPPLVAIFDDSLTPFNAVVIRADIYSERGDHQAAISTYQRAQLQPYYLAMGANGQAFVHQNMGITYNNMGAPQLAENSLRKAIELNTEAGNKTNLSFTQSSLLRSLNLQGRYAEAETQLLAGLNTLVGVYPNNKAPVIGELYARAATTQSLQNNFTRADSLLKLSAISLLEEPTFREPGGLPILEGATIYGQEDMLEMLTAKRDAFVRAYEQNARPDGLELALAACHSIDTLLRLNRSQLSLTSSLGQFIENEADQYALSVDLALRLYRTTKDDRYLNEAYQFASGQKSNLLRRYLTSPGLASSLGVPEATVAEKTDLELRVLTTERALQNAALADQPALRDSVLRLNAQVDKLKRQIASDYPAFARALRGFPAIDPSVAAATLNEDQLVVEYFLSADSIYMFTLGKADGLNVETVSRPGDLTDLIGSVVDQDAGATQLYDLLITPLLEDRPEITRLQLIPDGELWKLPFAALKNGDRFLIQDYALSFAYAAPLLFDPDLAARAAVQADNYLGYGISYQDILEGISASGNRSADALELRDMGQLPWAGREVETAASIIGGDYRLEGEATKARFLTEAGDAGILHLSMHGLLRPNPMESALVFRGNGEKDFALLTMGEVLGGNYPAELTVLSACHTGGGDLQTSEGMQSIGRAFMAVGSQATITSAWEARDEATHDILVAFYEALANGDTKDVALQGAIRAYLQNGTAADRRPENWANLTLTGSVTPLQKHKPWVAIVLGLGVALGMGVMAFSRLKNKAGTQDAG